MIKSKHHNPIKKNKIDYILPLLSAINFWELSRKKPPKPQTNQKLYSHVKYCINN